MKKTLLLTSIAMLVAMTSCMRDEVVEVNKGHVIGFRTAVDTRGMEAYWDSLDAFYVTALEYGTDIPYFVNVPFVHTNSNDYMSNTEYYWPGNDRRLMFYAYSDVDNATVTITHEEKSIKGFTVKNNISEQRDFIYAHNDGDLNGEVYIGLEEQSSVPLDFHHKLSKIYIAASTSSDYVYNCKGIRIGGVYNKGDMADLAEDEWTIAADAVESTFDKMHDEPFVITSNNSGWLMGEQKDYDGDDKDDYAFMLPQTFEAWDPTDPASGGAYLAVYLQITTAEGSVVFPSAALDTDGDGYEWAAIPIPANEWKSRYSYGYWLDFTNGAGYIAPGSVNVGSPVLGDATIKVFASLDEMPGSSEEMVVNPDMIGEWTATRFEEHETRIFLEAESIEYTESGNVSNIVLKYDEEGNPVFKKDAEGNVLYYDCEEVILTDPTEINHAIDGFNKITILDGKKLITKVPGSNLETKVDYVVNDENYILIDCYRYDDAPVGSYDRFDYYANPRIEEIVRATEHNDGYAKITVYYCDYDNWTWEDLDGDGTSECVPYMYEDVQYIYYDIAYIGPDVE